MTIIKNAVGELIAELNTNDERVNTLFFILGGLEGAEDALSKKDAEVIAKVLGYARNNVIKDKAESCE